MGSGRVSLETKDVRPLDEAILLDVMEKEGM